MPRGRSAYYRRESRVLALQALYEADMTGHSPQASFQWLKAEANAEEASLEYAVELLAGVARQREGIDQLIQRYAPAWPVRQLPVVDRNILRLAFFEIQYGQGIPSKVAINEAVELAKTFGSESSARFVNGVLGSLMDEMEGAKVGGKKEPAPATHQISQEGD